MADSATFSMRVDAQLLERVDHNASQAGMNRTQYLLSWLPETYESDTETSENKRSRSAR